MWRRIKHFFVPCEENTFKPHFLERFSMGIMLLLVVCTFTLSNIQALLWINSNWLVSTILPAVIVDITNEERDDGNLGVLTRNELLDHAATLKAQHMAKNGDFAHESPDGITPWHWFDEVGYNYVYAGENLAVRFTDSSEVVDAWMKSPTHRANILNGTYVEIGVGTAKGTYKGTPTVFVVQLFGTRRADMPVVEEVAYGRDTQKDEVPIEVREAGDTSQVLSEQVTRMPTTSESVMASDTEVESNEMASVVETVPTTSPSTVLQHTIPSDRMSFASTSRVGVPLMVHAGSTGPSTALFERGVTQSSIILQYIYLILASIVTGSLLVSICVEWRKQNPIQIAYACGLILLMLTLYHVHLNLTGGVTIL